jgi:hypothetical protein
MFALVIFKLQRSRFIQQDECSKLILSVRYKYPLMIVTWIRYSRDNLLKPFQNDSIWESVVRIKNDIRKCRIIYNLYLSARCK